MKIKTLNAFVFSLLIIFSLMGTLFAAEFDAPYKMIEKKHGAEWAKQDKEIDAKLADLEKKFGKKPNHYNGVDRRHRLGHAWVLWWWQGGRGANTES